MPAALINALSRALKIQLKTLPLTPESLWKAEKEAKDNDIL
jgi:CO/xanthine dehydrogenase Mo-binding subunit